MCVLSRPSNSHFFVLTRQTQPKNHFSSQLLRKTFWRWRPQFFWSVHRTLYYFSFYCCWEMGVLLLHNKCTCETSSTVELLIQNTSWRCPQQPTHTNWANFFQWMYDVLLYHCLSQHFPSCLWLPGLFGAVITQTPFRFRFLSILVREFCLYYCIIGKLIAPLRHPWTLWTMNRLFSVVLALAASILSSVLRCVGFLFVFFFWTGFFDWRRKFATVFLPIVQAILK